MSHTGTALQIDSVIRSRIDAFISEIDQLVRQAAVDAVRSALGGVSEAAPPTRPVSTPRGPVAMTPRRLLARDAMALAGPLESLLRAEGAMRLEGIAARTRMPIAKLQPLVGYLAGRGKLVQTGEGRGALFAAL